MYVDDTVIYYPESLVNAIRENLQDLKRVQQWLISNRLILNHSKSKGLLWNKATYFANLIKICTADPREKKGHRESDEV